MDHGSEFDELEREQARLLAASLPAAIAAEVNKSPDGLTARALVASGGNLSLFYQEVMNSPEAPREVRDLASDYMQKADAQREAENDAFRRTVTGVGEAVFASSILSANNAYAANLTRENEQPGGPNGANGSGGSLANNLLGLSAQQMAFLQSISSMTQAEWRAKTDAERSETIDEAKDTALDSGKAAFANQLKLIDEYNQYVDGLDGLSAEDRKLKKDGTRALSWALHDGEISETQMAEYRTKYHLDDADVAAASKISHAADLSAATLKAQESAEEALKDNQNHDNDGSLKNLQDVTESLTNVKVSEGVTVTGPGGCSYISHDDLAQKFAASDAALDEGKETAHTAQQQSEFAGARADNLDVGKSVYDQVAQAQVNSAPVENDYGDDEPTAPAAAPPTAPAAVDLAANPALDDSHPAARTNDLSTFQAAQCQLAALDVDASAAPADPAFLPTRRPAAGLSSQAGM